MLSSVKLAPNNKLDLKSVAKNIPNYLYCFQVLLVNLFHYGHGMRLGHGKPRKQRHGAGEGPAHGEGPRGSFRALAPPPVLPGTGASPRGDSKEPFKLSYYGFFSCIFSHSSWLRRHNLIYEIIEKNATLYSVPIELCEYEMRKNVHE